MCDANEVFFQGQILPFRHSVSSGANGLFQYHRSISKSESVDGSSSSITMFSSRSSSISSSHRSYSSRSSAATTPPWRKLPHPPQNHLRSHRNSPPKTNFPIPGIIRTNNGICSKKTSSSSVWNILRLGILVTSPPGIAFQDLKSRCPIPKANCKNFRSPNCTSRNSSNNKIISDTQKRKPRGFLIGGCNCSNDAVDTVRSRVANMKKSASEMEKQASVVQPTESPKQQATRKQGTHHRTFEWLKQLSLEETAEET